MRQKYGLEVRVAVDRDGEKTIKVWNKNRFRICDIVMIITEKKEKKARYIDCIEAESTWKPGKNRKSDTFIPVGYYEGERRYIDPGLFDPKRGVYQDKKHHALVWPEDVMEDSRWRRSLVYDFPEEELSVTLNFVARGLRIAFIGHSFTGLWDSAYYYFRELAKMGGWNAQVAYSYWGGTGIAQYAGLVPGSEQRAEQCDKVLDANSYYDFCSFAGNSDEALPAGDGWYERRERMLAGAKILYGKSLRKGAQMILWVPQAYRFGFLQGRGVKPWHLGQVGDSYEKNGRTYHLTLTQHGMTLANLEWYKHIAREVGIRMVAPVAAVYEELTKKYIDQADPYITPGLEGGDLGHQNNLGNYAAACVYYAMIFGESPEGLGIPESHTFGMAGGPIREEQAALIQRLAWNAARQYR